MKALIVLIAFLSAGASAKADMVFAKENSSLVLTIKSDRTAEITKLKKGSDAGKEVLIAGSIQGEDSSLTIVREEGDVCPPVSIELFHDIKLGENMSATVRSKFEETGTAAARYCQDVRLMDGSYTRVK